ncbi:hypothetical protein ABQF34_29470 [Mycolicibacterium boenickei]
MHKDPAPTLARLSAGAQCHVDELMPRIPMVPGLRCQDHVTFVATDEAAFSEYWGSRGLRAQSPINTERYPARHIAFSENPDQTLVCEEMVGLSVSSDPASPINRLADLYGGCHIDERGEVAVGRVQHVAFAVDGGHEIADVRAALVRQGVRFMTPIMTFTDPDTGAHLQQMFVACKVPYGPFVEIIKRGLGRGGEPFQGFNADQIDTLYEYYDAYSGALCGGTVCP